MDDKRVKIRSFEVIELNNLQLSGLYRNHRLHSVDITLGKAGVDDTMTLNWYSVIHFEGLLSGVISDAYLRVNKVTFSGRRGINKNNVCEWETFKNSFKNSKGTLIASQLWEDGPPTVLEVEDGIVTEYIGEVING